MAPSSATFPGGRALLHHPQIPLKLQPKNPTSVTCCIEKNTWRIMRPNLPSVNEIAPSHISRSCNKVRTVGLHAPLLRMPRSRLHLLPSAVSYPPPRGRPPPAWCVFSYMLRKTHVPFETYRHPHLRNNKFLLN